MFFLQWPTGANAPQTLKWGKLQINKYTANSKEQEEVKEEMLQKQQQEFNRKVLQATRGSQPSNKMVGANQPSNKMGPDPQQSWNILSFIYTVFYNIIKHQDIYAGNITYAKLPPSGLEDLNFVACFIFAVFAGFSLLLQFLVVAEFLFVAFFCTGVHFLLLKRPLVRLAFTYAFELNQRSLQPNRDWTKLSRLIK